MNPILVPLRQAERDKLSFLFISPSFVRVAIAFLIMLSSQGLLSGLSDAKGDFIKTKASAFVVDANTGLILHNYLGNDLRHPASLTKMMTLYIAFETIKKNQLSFSSHITVSERAASVAPSKLGLLPGSEITLEDAIKALIVKSANDMAVAIAERISGSEVAFAKLMTLKAKQIGMQKTVFRNASGLPNKNQVTTAQDMVTLGLRLQKDHPDYYNMFSLQSFTYEGKIYKTHNTLLSTFEGVDGIKTGYTRMSGFNIVSSYQTNGKRIVGAVFGGVSASARDAHMRMLLALAIEKASKERALLKTQDTQHEPELSNERETKPAMDLNNNRKPEIQSRSQENGDEKQLGKASPPNPFFTKQKINTAILNPKIANTLQNEASSNTENYSVQIGTYRNIDNAERALSLAQNSIPDLLKDHPSQIVPLNKAGTLLFVAKFNDFKNDIARKTCLELLQLKFDCLIVGSNKID